MMNWKKLLVLLLVLLVLVALLIPAIQRVKEAANAKVCGGNLRMLAVAAHNYHNDYNILPPGVLGSYPNLLVNTFETPGNGAPQVGCLALLLLFLEGENLLNKHWAFSFPRDLKSRGVGEAEGKFDHDPNWWGFNERNRELAAFRIKIFECPSDTLSDGMVPHKILLAFGFTPTGTWGVEGSGESTNFGKSNYAGVAGAYGQAQEKTEIKVYGRSYTSQNFKGVFTNRSRLAFSNIMAGDGTSNTLFFGESLGSDIRNGMREIAWCWMGIGMMPTAEGLRPTNLNTSQGGASYRGFSSRHRNGVQFVCGDGSVRTLRLKQTTIVGSDDWCFLQAHAGWRDSLCTDSTAIPN